MSTVMTNTEFVRRLKEIATNHTTLYVMGCFGAPLNEKNKTRYCNNHSYNKAAARTKMIKAASEDTFGFDCVCLIKAVLWGWNGDLKKTYGGATYASNGVPDISANTMITKCSEISTDFSSLVPGEAVWMDGHIGVYIGDGLAIESTPKWDNKVMITACNCSKTGYKRRNWTKHGKLPYVSYELVDKPVEPTPTPKPTPQTFKVGDIVYYKGNTHYTSANSKSPKACKGGKAKITQIYRLGKSAHPYLLVRVSGGGATVHGWVDEGSFDKV